MIKKICMIGVLVLLVVGFFVFVKIGKMDRKKVSDVEYTVLLEENIPEEIFDELEEYKYGVCKHSYIFEDKLYIVICYGKQDASGYTINVNELYESDNAIYVETTLMGTGVAESASMGMESKKTNVESSTCPYIVLELDRSEKTVVYL